MPSARKRLPASTTPNRKQTDISSFTRLEKQNNQRTPTSRALQITQQDDNDDRAPSPSSSKLLETNPYNALSDKDDDDDDDENDTQDSVQSKDTEHIANKMDVDEDEGEVSSTVDLKESEVEVYMREFPPLKLSKEAKATAKKAKEANASCRAELNEYYQTQMKLTGTLEVPTSGNEAHGSTLQKDTEKHNNPTISSTIDTNIDLNTFTSEKKKLMLH